MLIQDKDGYAISWTVKNRVMQNTNKKAIVTFADTEKRVQLVIHKMERAALFFYS